MWVISSFVSEPRISCHLVVPVKLLQAHMEFCLLETKCFSAPFPLHMLKPSSQYEGIWRWRLWVVVRSLWKKIRKGIGILIKRSQQTYFFCHMRLQQKVALYETGRSLSADTKCAGVLIWLPSPQTYEKSISVFHKPSSLRYSVTAAWMDSETA